MKILFLLVLSPMRNSLKQTKDPQLSLLSLQNTTPLLARISYINSMNLWMILHLKQLPAITMSFVSFHLCQITQRNVYPFHLNISSLSFHIKEGTTLISEHNLTFDIFWSKWNEIQTEQISSHLYYNTWVQLRVYFNWMQ